MGFLGWVAYQINRFVGWVTSCKWKLGWCWRCGHYGLKGHEWSEYSGICSRCIHQVQAIIAIEIAKQKARGERDE